MALDLPPVNIKVKVQTKVKRAVPGYSFNPDFVIGMRHRDDKEGCRFGRKKCAHTFSMQALFSDEDASLFGGECHYYCKFRV